MHFVHGQREHGAAGYYLYMNEQLLTFIGLV